MKEITLIGEVGYEITLERVRLEVGDSDNVKINIFSVGGSVVEGLAIYDFLKNKDIEFVVEGLVASMATIITSAGKVKMGEGFFMIHNPFGMSLGTDEDMKKDAETLEKMKKKIVDIYEKKTGLTRDEIKEMMDKDTWMDAEEAFEKGFIDEVNDYQNNIANSMNLDRYTINVGAKNYAASVLLKEDKNVIKNLTENEAETNFEHNSETNEEEEPQWGNVDKKELPVEAFAYEAEGTEKDKKTTWKYPHHWIEGATQFSEKGVAENGTMYLHKGGLGYAWAAAQGARTEEKAEKAIRDHLQEHIEAIGMDEEDCYKAYDKIKESINKGVNMSEKTENKVNVEGIFNKLDDNEKAYIKSLTETKDELKTKLDSMSEKVDELISSKNEAESKLAKRDAVEEMKNKYPNVEGVEDYVDLYMTEDKEQKAKIEKMLDGLNTKRQAGDTEELGSDSNTLKNDGGEDKVQAKAKQYQKDGMNYAEAYVKAYKEINVNS